MYRLGVVALFLAIVGAACGAAWLAGLSNRHWAPSAAFWTTLMGLGSIAAAFGVQFAD